MALVTAVQSTRIFAPSTESLRPVGLASRSSSLMVRETPAGAATQLSPTVPPMVTVASEASV